MSRTPSNMLALGTKAPDFQLIDSVSNLNIKLNNLKGTKGTVIMFICNHCPFVVHVNPEITRLAIEYQEIGISFIAISSNNIKNYPQDAPHLMKQIAEQQGYTFPYLFDETQKVAKAYEAACTPDFYLFDENLLLVYRGQLDDSRPGNNKPVNGIDLRNAIDALLSNTEVNQNQKPSIGCSIKWA